MKVEEIRLDSDAEKQGMHFFNEGLQHFDAQEFPQAKSKFEAAAQLLPNQPEILDNLGITLQQLGEWDQALTYHRRALEIFQKANFKIGVAKALLNIGDVHNRRGELVEALRHYQRALAIVEQDGDRRIHVTLLNAVGVIYTKQGNYETALDVLHQAEEVNEEAKDREELLKCYANLGTTYE